MTNNKSYSLLKLSIEEITFCNEFVKTGNRRQAYITAFNKTKNADILSYKICKKSYISQYIKQLMLFSPTNIDIEKYKNYQILIAIRDDPNTKPADCIKAIKMLSNIHKDVKKTPVSKFSLANPFRDITRSVTSNKNQNRTMKALKYNACMTID
ncbi:MAG: terminase small subunit [Nitrospirae bacterium]|nr:terminase small subunit [Nitrospirota bacterium]